MKVGAVVSSSSKGIVQSLYHDYMLGFYAGVGVAMIQIVVAVPAGTEGADERLHRHVVSCCLLVMSREQTSIIS